MSISKTGAKKPENRRFFIRLALAMVIYLVSLFTADFLIEERGLSGPLAYALVMIPGLCLAAIFWIFARLVIEERDEFVRLLYIRQNMVATGLTLTAAGIWGFLEQYHLVEHVVAFWWPTIWCFGTGIGALYNQVTMISPSDAE